MNTSTLFLSCTFPGTIEACAMIGPSEQAQLIGSTPKMWLGTKMPLASQPTSPEDCTFDSVAAVTPTATFERAQLYCGGFAHGNWLYLESKPRVPGTDVYDVVIETEMVQYEAFSSDHMAEVTLWSNSSHQPSSGTIVAALHAALAYVAANGCNVA